MKKVKTKGQKNEENEILQTINNLYDFVSSLEFQQKIQKARNILNIPSNGFPLSARDNDNVIYLNYEPKQWEPKISKQSTYLLIEEVLKIVIQKLGQDSTGCKVPISLHTIL